MKKIERGSIMHLIILIIMISICGMIIYPIFDFILSKFITNSKFVYTVKSDIIQPIISGVIAGLVIWIVDKKAK